MRDWIPGSALLRDADTQTSARLTWIFHSDSLLKTPSDRLIKLFSHRDSKGKGYLIKALIILFSHDISSLFQCITEKMVGNEATSPAPQVEILSMGLTWNDRERGRPL